MKKIKLWILLLLSWFLIHIGYIIIDGLFSTPVKSEYAIILGNKVNPNGTLSEGLKARVDKGLALYNNNMVNKLFVSGGFGREGHYEAEKMAEYLFNNGVPKSVIIIDNKGNNTWATVTNFKKLANTNSAIVVSQYFHITRSKLALKKVGVKNISSASPKYFEIRDSYSILREFVGFYKYLIIY